MYLLLRERSLSGVIARAIKIRTWYVETYKAILERGGASAEHYGAKQQRILDDVRGRYQRQVSDLLHDLVLRFTNAYSVTRP
jgi:hypothetical protein